MLQNSGRSWGFVNVLETASSMTDKMTATAQAWADGTHFAKWRHLGSRELHSMRGGQAKSWSVPVYGSSFCWSTFVIQAGQRQEQALRQIYQHVNLPLSAGKKVRFTLPLNNV
jgi:hypothetical protein